MDDHPAMEDVYVVKPGDENGPFMTTKTIDGGVTDYPVCHLRVTWPDQQQQHSAKKRILYTLHQEVDESKTKLWNRYYDFESSIHGDDVVIYAEKKCALFGYTYQYYYFDDDFHIPENSLKRHMTRSYFPQFCQKLERLCLSSQTPTHDHFTTVTENRPLPVSFWQHYSPEQSEEDEESDTDTDFSDYDFDDAAFEMGNPNVPDNMLPGVNNTYGQYTDTGLWIPWQSSLQGRVGHMNPGQTYTSRRPAQKSSPQSAWDVTFVNEK